MLSKAPHMGPPAEMETLQQEQFENGAPIVVPTAYVMQKRGHVFSRVTLLSELTHKMTSNTSTQMATHTHTLTRIATLG